MQHIKSVLQLRLNWLNTLTKYAETVYLFTIIRQARAPPPSQVSTFIFSSTSTPP